MLDDPDDEHAASVTAAVTAVASAAALRPVLRPVLRLRGRVPLFNVIV